MKIKPLLLSCTPEKMYLMGPYEGFLLNNIKSRGNIQYLYIFGLFEKKIPILYYTAELSVTSEELYVGLFKDDKHINLGKDDQCKDQMTFLSKALNYVCESHSVDMNTVKELPKERASDEFKS